MHPRRTLTLGATNLLDSRAKSFLLGNPFSVADGRQVRPLRPRTIRLGLTLDYEGRILPNPHLGDVLDATRPRSPLARVFRNAGWLLGAKAVGAALSLVYLGFATRLLGPAGFGAFVLVLGLGQAVSTTVSFQTWQIVVHYGTIHLHDARPDRLRRLVLFCTLLDLSAAAIGALLACAGVVLLGPRFGWASELQRDAFLFALVLLFSLRSTPTGILRLHDRYREAAVADTLTPAMRMLGAAFILSGEPSVTRFLAAWAAAEFVTAAAYWRSAARVGRLFPGPGEVVSRRAVEEENDGLWRYSLSVNGSSTLEHGSKQLAVLLVGWFAGSLAAGGYRLAYQLGQALAKVSATVSRAAFPELARVRGAGMSGDLRRLLGQITGVAFAAGILVITALWLFGDTLIVLVAGRDYAAIYPLLLLLGAAAAVDLAGVAFEPALFAAGRSSLALRLRLATSALLLALVVISAISAGVIGAAWATLIGSVVSASVLGLGAMRAVRR